MQVLQAGSFINLENDGSLEKLKFTANLLAEHTAKMVKESLNAQDLETLANNLWQKAEYVTRETERRSLQQIFARNFTERFRELKSDFESLTAGIVDSFKQTIEQVKGEANDEVIVTQENASPTTQTREVEAQKDEFLGLVNSGESLDEKAVQETQSPTATTEEIKLPIVQAEAFDTENENGTAQRAVLESEQVSQEAETVKETVKADKPPMTTQNSSPTTDQVKSAAAPQEAKEPFEFGKCTVNLNLTLLPSSSCAGDETSRKAIISTASHQMPPEIEYLEIETGEDLEQIAGLVKDKLARFRASLPVKYIEQLRASKTKTMKPNQTMKSTAPTVSSEKTSGEQKMQSAASNQSGVKSAEQTTEKTSETDSIIAPPTSSNSNTQPSLF